MGARSGVAVRWLGIALLLAACLAAGCSGLTTSRDSGELSGGAVSAEQPPATVQSSDAGMETYGTSAGSAESAKASAVDAAGDSLVISTAGISVEVKDLDAGVAAIRALATKYGASIANLTTNAGNDPLPVPQPLDGTSTEYAVPSPGGATITLRVPSEKLAAAEAEIAALGRVISQSSTQDDVTQQHVDMKARLKNMQAEEARLRTFFLKAKRVSEMLAIEQELSRVRGEIESMQAQIAYLERQAALATLTVSLSQPGALVSPSAGGWGFSEAIRDGVRAAAAVVRGMITMLLAFSPVILLGLVAFVAIRAVVVRRRKRRETSESADSVESTSDQPETPAGE